MSAAYDQLVHDRCDNCNHSRREHDGTGGVCLYEFPRGSIREGYVCGCRAFPTEAALQRPTPDFCGDHQLAHGQHEFIRGARRYDCPGCPPPESSR